MPLLIQIDTPYALFALGILSAGITWLIKEVIKHGKEIVAMQTALKYYFETLGKGAAVVLDSPNPTPEHIRELLRKHVEGKLEVAERNSLREWLRQIRDDPKAERAERSAALSLLGALGAMERLSKPV